MGDDYDRWITYRHLWCCLLCRQVCTSDGCGMCTDKWLVLA